YMSAQLLSYLEGELWHRNASQANQNAARIVNALKQRADVEVAHPVQINEVFAALPWVLIETLRASGIQLRPWNLKGVGQGYRLVMSYCDSADDIRLFEEACGSVVTSRWALDSDHIGGGSN
ncbi:L-threonine aldolase, partial (plasmid) [Rhizobium sp. CCGE 510]